MIAAMLAGMEIANMAKNRLKKAIDDNKNLSKDEPGTFIGNIAKDMVIPPIVQNSLGKLFGEKRKKKEEEIQNLYLKKKKEGTLNETDRLHLFTQEEVKKQLRDSNVSGYDNHINELYKNGFKFGTTGSQDAFHSSYNDLIKGQFNFAKS